MRDSGLADRMRRAREALGVSVPRFAHKLGVSPQAVYYWERGWSKPRPDNLSLIARALDVTEDYLNGVGAPSEAKIEQKLDTKAPDQATPRGLTSISDVEDAANNTIKLARSLAKVRGIPSSEVRLVLQLGDLKMELN